MRYITIDSIVLVILLSSYAYFVIKAIFDALKEK